MSLTSEEPELHPAKSVTVHVNTKPVELPSHKVTGREIKEAAIAQGVEIQLDFLLTEEAHGEHPARTIADNKKVEVTKKSEFTANSEDDDS